MELLILVALASLALGLGAGVVQAAQDWKHGREVRVRNERRSLEGLGWAVMLAREERRKPAIFDYEAGHTSWRRPNDTNCQRGATPRQRAIRAMGIYS